jgi:hypothetical protein
MKAKIASSARGAGKAWLGVSMGRLGGRPILATTYQRRPECPDLRGRLRAAFACAAGCRDFPAKGFLESVHEPVIAVIMVYQLTR